MGAGSALRSQPRPSRIASLYAWAWRASCRFTILIIASAHKSPGLVIREGEECGFPGGGMPRRYVTRLLRIAVPCES